MTETHLNLDQIKKSDHKFRLNLINSLTGIKPANLVGTKNGVHLNLAIISSVVHLGSNPPLLGFIMRPKHEVRRDTYNNIISNNCFTVNCVHTSFTEKAHYTSAKFQETVSEFEACGLTPVFKDEFEAPYVEESQLKIGLNMKEIIPISSNNTLMIIGEIEHIYVNKQHLDKRGYIQLADLNVAGIGGLNSYYQLEKIAEYPYARVNETPNFNHEKTTPTV